MGATTVEATGNRKVTAGYAVAGHGPTVVVPAHSLREALTGYRYGRCADWYTVWEEERGYGVTPVDVFPTERGATAAARQRGEREIIDLRRGAAVPVA